MDKSTELEKGKVGELKTFVKSEMRVTAGSGQELEDAVSDE